MWITDISSKVPFPLNGTVQFGGSVCCFMQQKSHSTITVHSCSRHASGINPAHQVRVQSAVETHVRSRGAVPDRIELKRCGNEAEVSFCTNMEPQSCTSAVHSAYKPQHDLRTWIKTCRSDISSAGSHQLRLFTNWGRWNDLSGIRACLCSCSAFLWGLTDHIHFFKPLHCTSSQSWLEKYFKGLLSFLMCVLFTRFKIWNFSISRIKVESLVYWSTIQ